MVLGSLRAASAAVGAAAALAASLVVTPAGAAAPPPPPQAQANLMDVDGAFQGTVRFTQDGDRVRVEVSATGLTPGWHGLHVHGTGDCTVGDPTNPFTAAGGHLGTPEAHGTDGHDGDLPPLWADADGTAHATVHTDNLTLAQLLDDDGSAVIVHAGRDNLAHIDDRYRHEPYGPSDTGPDTATRNTGDAGSRQRCGVVASTGGGYWLAAADGGVFSYGEVGFHGSAGGIRLNRPVVGMESSASGRGYWLVASDGGVFSYGDAAFHGSTGSLRLNRPVVGMAATSTGMGYWLVASDGGVFAYGDAAFHGSTGDIRLNADVVAMVPTPTDGGYWLIAADGGVFAYGDARFEGSRGGQSQSTVVAGDGG